MRRTAFSLAGAAALALTLSACGDSGSDDAGGDDGCTPVEASFTVHAEDQLKFDAEAYDTGAGCNEITYENDGGVAHTLLIKDVDGFKLSIGDTDTGTVALDAGTYTLYCDIPGHEAAGMHAELTVS